ncbi:MAG TPA: porin, partial [Burkholderiales bacterium]|nr:porin [Burkholderiales bacterium]
MQKKLLAAAVSGALGTMVAPVALAQNATVNVYGSLYAEYAQISHGMRNPTDIYQNYDHWQNPGSAIGFRGEEKLGGGMSAWFQCETTMDYRGSNNTATGNQSQGICNRDSAFGLKGAFGNVFMGNWGTPMKRVTNDMVGANDTGVFGAARVLYGQSSTFGVQPPNAAAGAGSTPGAYRRRQSNLLSY